MKIKNLIAVAALLMGSTNAFAGLGIGAQFAYKGVVYETSAVDASAKTANATVYGISDNENGKAIITNKSLTIPASFNDLVVDGETWTITVTSVNIDWATKGENATEIETLSVNGTNFTNKFQLENSTYGLTKLKNLTVVDKEEPMETSLAALLNATTATLETLDISACAGITAIPDNAFLNGALTSISVPEGVTTIGASAFEGCANLTAFTFGEKLTSLGYGAFAKSGITAADLSKTQIATITAYAFAGASALASVTLPADLNAIAEGAFSATAITTFEIPATVTIIEANAFANSKSLATVTGSFEGLTVKAIPAGLFNGCEALATVPDLTEMTVIYENAFNGTALTTLTLGDVSIRANAFANCAALTEATINSGDIWNNAFQSCTSLKTVNYVAPAGSNDIDPTAFIGCIFPVKIYTLETFFMGGAYPKDLDPVDGDPDTFAPTNCQFEAVATPADGSFTIGASGFYKLYKDVDVAFDKEDGLKCFTVSVDNDGDGTAYFQGLKVVEDKYWIPAKTPVIIKGEANKEVEYNEKVGPSSILWDDLFTFDADCTLAAFQTGTNGTGWYGAPFNFVNGQYLYRLVNQDGLGFSQYTGSTLKAGQFFIQSVKAPDAAGRLNVVWLDEDGNVIDGAATAIKGVKAAAKAGAIYNLSGQKVNASYKGVVIKDGKKYIQK